MQKYIMALDQGTTSSRCILFDKKGSICSMAQMEFTQIFPKPGWVEHDPMEIWSTQIAVAAKAMGKLGVTEKDIAAIGITNQRETTIVWEKATGKPVYNAIVWQCRRTAEKAEELAKDGFGDEIHKKTGLIPDAYFSATKLAWILDHVEQGRERARSGELLFGTVDTWLIWKLTGGQVHVTDYTNASRTMLFDIHKRRWDTEILQKLDIPCEMLPEVKPSSTVYGYTKDCLIGDGIAIAGAAGDQQAALFGQCCFRSGEVKNTYGTGCFLLMNTGDWPVISGNGLLTTIAAGVGDQVPYALEGSVFVAGAAIQWLRDDLRMIDRAAESEIWCRKVEDANGIYVVPAFTGLGAPYWDEKATASISGITRTTGKAEVIKAALDCIAYQITDLVRAMEQDTGMRIEELRVDGGPTRNGYLMQFQSDITNKRVKIPDAEELSGIGAAYMAGISAGVYDLEKLAGNMKRSVYEPKMDDEIREKKYAGWKAAVDGVLSK